MPIRLTELKLPLEHSAAELKAAILKRLGIAADELVGFSVFRRSHDARKPAAIVFIYTLDIEVGDEKALLARHKGDRHIGPTPDTRYHFVTQAPSPTTPRPIVIGTGPCGLFPAGEGAGYAGGILSAAVDGIKVAEAVALAFQPGT